MLTDRELQTLRNMGNEAEEAADEIENLRADLANARGARDFALAVAREAQEIARMAQAATPAPAEPVAWLRDFWGPDCGPYYEIHKSADMTWRSKDGWTPLFAAPVAQAEPYGWVLPMGSDDSLFRDHRTVQACTGNKWEGWKPVYLAAPVAATPAPAPLTLGRELFKFDTFTGWVNQRQRAWKAAGVRSEVTICIDAKGRPCRIGRDFAKARDEDAFPVRVYLMRDEDDPKAGQGKEASK